MRDENERLAERIGQALGHAFGDPALAIAAVTHRSYLHENPEAGDDNERLEYIGDAALGLAVADVLFHRFPEAAEGALTRQRASLIREESLATAARNLGLGPLLRLGRGEASTGGRDKDSLLANAFEALLGAVFLDAGYHAVRKLAERHLDPLIDHDLDAGDAKSRLQELLQARGSRPVYRVTSEQGPAHDRRFEVELRFEHDPGRAAARGTGRSKKEAETEAARAALSALGKEA